MLFNKVVMKILVFGTLFRTNVVSMAIKSYNQLKFLNLVTMATTKILHESKDSAKLEAKNCFLLRRAIFHSNKSYNQHKLLNLVTTATTKIV